MPPKSLLAQALQQFKHNNILKDQMKSLLTLLTADSFVVPNSPAKLVTNNSLLKSVTRSFENLHQMQSLMRTRPTCPGHNKLSLLMVQL